MKYADENKSPDEIADLVYNLHDNFGKKVKISQSKDYIFALVFLKFLNDNFEKKYQEVVEKRGEERAERKKYYPKTIFVPEEARWSTLRGKTEKVDLALNDALSKLSAENNELKDIFTEIDFTSEETGKTVIDKLLTELDKFTFDDDPEVSSKIGQAFEKVIVKVAEESADKGGDFATPGEVNKLMAQLLKPDEKMKVYDPASGAGGSLISIAQYIEDQGKDYKELSYKGQEVKPETWAISRMNLLFHNMYDVDIGRDDTLENPVFTTGKKLEQFDIIICDPPFSDKYDKDLAEADPYGRYEYGLPWATYCEGVFLLHMISSLKDNGKLASIMPHGVLFRGSESDIREGIVDDDLLEAVIGLPEKLLFGSGIPSAILVINKNKSEERKGKVLFIHAAEGYRDGSNVNTLRNEDIDKIVSTFENYIDEERYSRVVDRDEIVENEYILNISRYVDTFEPEEEIPLDEAIADWKTARKEREDAVKEVDGYLEELGYTV